MTRRAALLLVTTVLVLGGAAAPAQACACGGPAPIPGTDVSVSGEAAMVRWDGEQEEIVLRLDMLSDADETGLIVPTPTPATVTAADAELFDRLEAAMIPQFVDEWDWWGGFGGGDGAAGGAPPEVLARVQLGPIEATTLAASDAIGLADWLDANGYGLSDQIAAELPAYVDAGWSFVALRLTGEVPFDGALDPIRFTFASDEFVYPMRMSRAAEVPQTVRLYVLGEHRVEVAGSDGDLSASVSVLWADRHDDAELAALGGYLTVIDVVYSDPASQVTEDLLIVDAADDAAIRPVVTVVHPVAFGSMPLGPVLLVGSVVLVLIVAGALILRLPRQTRP